mmetsp:Transcript_15594/g.22984  ORF Transcript_15594/g.22984 Transcript_15594/m.22984 type:complete len:280 (-) Transcript_15594:235-1074(-)|eukprot:CAMPEP_0194224874 /NCGR_PEP_ID=MMETSP0156-20130528/38353_1 /TAXON_ID=33649 /ORGANISM="Thalassionema nitzschioides, Strain L26-B" /LENGTH=279 /DNA_ID=CAMNT_0038956605 /DNA_START=166 /DNA_END=1005 /DNA_ORIENTATION=-
MSSTIATVRFLLLWSLYFSPALANNGGSGHPHQGKVTPFEPGDPNVKLDGKAEGILKNGNPFQTQIQSGSSGRGLVVQDVKAPTSIVWDRILDYNNYANMVPKTIESENYNVQENKDGTTTIYTRMKVGFPLLKLEFFIKHEHQPELNSLTWTLDYSKKSDFDDSCGYWYVISHPDNPNWTRVYYSVEVSMFDWVPKFAVNFMSTKALVDATAWVKKFSELKYVEEGPIVEPIDPPTTAVAEAPTPTPGLSRYAMLLSVLVLSVYNIKLLIPSLCNCPV